MTLSLSLCGALIFGAAFLGGIIPLWVKPTSENHLKLFISFGAGLLLSMAFLHMIPEAFKLIPKTFGIWLLTGFCLLLFLERFIMVHACEEHGCHYHTLGIAAFLGLTIHGIIEGFALASSQLITNLGFLVLIAILSHKAPAGIALTSILKMSGKKNNQILGFVCGVALSGPLGIFLAYWILQSEDYQSVAGILLSISAGTFLYIGACDLLPEIHRTDGEKLKRLAAFCAGILISVLSGHLLD
ncbi:MAG: ZIP family metal transporter [Deltaproteobacteria bacterium]